ncbi:unnamed protein product [Parajaminaea phylloscopi]
MPPQLSASPASYWTDIKALVDWSASPPNNTRVGLLRSLLVRSVRISLVPEGHVQLPLRVRPALIVLNVLDLVLLGLLGFHPAGSSVPINDKVLHFVCFFLATALFYAVWDVDESARRHSALWRRMPLILSFAVCLLVGGIGSEFVQALLPFKRFDPFDILANLCGSSLGLWASYHAEKRYRLDREVRRLYRPLDPEEYGDDGPDDMGLMDDDDDEEDDHVGRGARRTGTGYGGRGAHRQGTRHDPAASNAAGASRSGANDVWSSTADGDVGSRGSVGRGASSKGGPQPEDLFSIGAEDGEQDDEVDPLSESKVEGPTAGSTGAGAAPRIPSDDDDSSAAWGRS